MRLGWKHPEPYGWVEIAHLALREDIGPGDLSSAILDPDEKCHWFIEAQEDGVVCGVGMAHYLLKDPDHPEQLFRVEYTDGERVKKGARIISGSARCHFVLGRERTTLNFLMMLSGVATLTRAFVDAVKGTDADILDTRKTVPGLRSLQKYAVRCGGGKNHRMGLFDGILIKDNHIRMAGSIKDAIERAKMLSGHMTMIEIECERLEQVEQALSCGVQVVMVDNMPPEQIREAVAMAKGRALVEASGGVSLENVRAVAEAGVDVISVGALTHSAPSLALHLEIE